MFEYLLVSVLLVLYHNEENAIQWRLFHYSQEFLKDCFTQNC